MEASVSLRAFRQRLRQTMSCQECLANKPRLHSPRLTWKLPEPLGRLGSIYSSVHVSLRESKPSVHFSALLWQERIDRGVWGVPVPAYLFDLQELASLLLLLLLELMCMQEIDQRQLFLSHGVFFWGVLNCPVPPFSDFVDRGPLQQKVHGLFFKENPLEACG